MFNACLLSPTCVETVALFDHCTLQLASARGAICVEWGVAYNRMSWGMREGLSGFDSSFAGTLLIQTLFEQEVACREGLDHGERLREVTVADPAGRAAYVHPQDPS